MFKFLVPILVFLFFSSPSHAQIDPVVEASKAVEAWEFCDRGVFHDGKKLFDEVLKTEKQKRPTAKVQGQLLHTTNVRILATAPYHFKADLAYVIQFEYPKDSNEFGGGYRKTFAVEMIARWPMQPGGNLCEVAVTLQN